jgi:hypothetical protein
VEDPQVCATHTTKDCITGNERGYGCPWMVYPGTLTCNAYCGMCVECLKTCPKNNIVINLRPFGDDLLEGNEHRLDEAYKAFIMLGCALLYSVVLLGPWGEIQQWANMESLPHWLLYAGGFLALNLLVQPGLFGITALVVQRLTRFQTRWQRLFIDFSYALIPMGLAAWIAFSLGFVLTNGSYALAVLSDPFGWGWNLFGTANLSWTPAGSELVSFVQVGVLTVGLLFSTNIAFRIARQISPNRQQSFRLALPVTTFLAVVTLAFLWLYMG